MNTTILVSKETRQMLQDLGKKSESYDSIIRRMANQIKMQERLEEFFSDEGFSSVEEAKEWTKLKIKSSR